MTIKMANSEVDGVSVVTLDGRIVLGEETNFFREKLKSMLAEGKKKIVLNMVNIKYIDSSGLGTLVAGHVGAKTQGASVRLCNLGKQFHGVMQITKLTGCGKIVLSQQFLGRFELCGSFRASEA